MAYDGSPVYAKLDLLRDILQPWADECFVGDEWGEWLQLLWQTADRGLGSVASNEKAETLLMWVLEELTTVIEQGDLDGFYDAEIVEAHAISRNVIKVAMAKEYMYQSEQKAVTNLIAALPDWLLEDKDLCPKCGNEVDGPPGVTHVIKTLYQGRVNGIPGQIYCTLNHKIEVED